MITFVLICAAMLAAAVALLARPLFRSVPEDPLRGVRSPVLWAVVLIVPVLAIALYASRSNWDWQRTLTPEEAAQQDLLNKISALEKRLDREPQDLEGWLLLGHSDTQLGRFQNAADAFQRAYDLSHGDDIDAITGLGEALALSNEATLDGRAGELFEEALRRAPFQPKALWYGSVAAIRAGKWELARARMGSLLALNPPPAIRNILEQQIQALDARQATAASQSPGEAGLSSLPAGSVSATSRRIEVSVTLAPELARKLTGATALFILARDPQNGGPPLAVVRRSSSELPLKVELSERDAMIPTRSIATVPRVQLVARISHSGTPQAQSGDFYGETEYAFEGSSGAARINIDRSVP